MSASAQQVVVNSANKALLTIGHWKPLFLQQKQPPEPSQTKTPIMSHGRHAGVQAATKGHIDIWTARAVKGLFFHCR
jgi:hypothetical protein